MSVTVYVNNWDKQPSQKVRRYCLEQYPNLMVDDFPEFIYPRDSLGRPYEEILEFENPYPQVHFSNSNWALFAGQLNLSETFGSCPHTQLPIVIRNALQLLNNKGRISSTRALPYKSHNLMGFGTTQLYVVDKLQQLIELFKFATQKKQFIYWG